MTNTEANVNEPSKWDGDESKLLNAMEQHAGMVHSTARRVLGNDAQADDVVQETFYQFARSANQIKGAISGWLHRVAVRRSLDLIRSESARRQREERYVSELDSPTPDWSEVERSLDLAMDSLPENERELLVSHYLQRETTIQIALRKGWSQATASRKIQCALNSLRIALRRSGVVIGITALVAGLTVCTQAAPATTLAALGKIVLAHTTLHPPLVPGWEESEGEIELSPSATTTTSLWKPVLVASSIALGTGTIVYQNSNRDAASADRPQPPASSVPIPSLSSKMSNVVPTNSDKPTITERTRNSIPGTFANPNQHFGNSGGTFGNARGTVFVGGADYSGSTIFSGGTGGGAIESTNSSKATATSFHFKTNYSFSYPMNAGGAMTRNFGGGTGVAPQGGLGPSLGGGALGGGGGGGGGGFMGGSSLQFQGLPSGPSLHR